MYLHRLGRPACEQQEGSRLFETLVQEGRQVDRSARRQAEAQVGEMRDSVESTVEQARGQAVATWDRMERAFDERLQRTLHRLGVPTRQDVEALDARIETLTEELRSRRTTTAKRKAPRKKAARAGTPRAQPAAAAGPSAASEPPHDATSGG